MASAEVQDHTGMEGQGPAEGMTSKVAEWLVLSSRLLPGVPWPQAKANLHSGSK